MTEHSSPENEIDEPLNAAMDDMRDPEVASAMRAEQAQQPPSPVSAEALDREESLLLSSYYSGRLNGDRLIREAFNRLRAHAQTQQDAQPIVGWRYAHKGQADWHVQRQDPREWLARFASVQYDVEPLYAAPAQLQQDPVAWAVSRWTSEVANRPLKNVHRRSLDTTWRQVIRHFGGDDVALCGPPHDELASTVTSTDSDSHVMGAAKRAATVVEGWSDNKREYADRVTAAQNHGPILPE